MYPWPLPLPSSITIPPSAVPADPEFKRINLSSINRLAVDIVVVSPCTIKSPDIVKSAKVGDADVTRLWLIAFTAAKLLTSESINAPAAVTLDVLAVNLLLLVVMLDSIESKLTA